RDLLSSVISIGSHPPPPALCPYTTLFRSGRHGRGRKAGDRRRGGAEALRDHGNAQLLDQRQRRAQRSVLAGPGAGAEGRGRLIRSEEHTSELQSRENLVCRLLLER